jgi:hypothetical protein
MNPAFIAVTSTLARCTLSRPISNQHELAS